MAVYMPHMNPNMISNVTTNPGKHTFTLLAYAPNKHVPHCTYMFHCTSTVVKIQAQHYFT